MPVKLRQAADPPGCTRSHKGQRESQGDSTPCPAAVRPVSSPFRASSKKPGRPCLRPSESVHSGMTPSTSVAFPPMETAIADAPPWWNVLATLPCASFHGFLGFQSTSRSCNKLVSVSLIAVVLTLECASEPPGGCV